MFQNLIQNARVRLFESKDRLKADFPWSFGKMTKAYLMACVYFAVATYVPAIVALVGFKWELKHNPHFHWLVWDAHSPYSFINPLTGDVRTMYFVLIAVLSIFCFVTGFGAEIWYIRRQFHKDGLSLRKSMAINLDSLGGSWKAAFWRAAVAFAAILGLNQLIGLLPLPPAHDPTAEFVVHLDSLTFLAMGLLTVIGGPVCEEFVFRGFLFNVCRTSFRKMGRWALNLLTGATVGAAGFLVLLSREQLDMSKYWHLQHGLGASGADFIMALGASVTDYVIRFGSDPVVSHCLHIALVVAAVVALLVQLLSPERLADYASILVSAATFAAFHLNLSGFLMLMAAGIVLAWLYRRTGTLIAPMMTHALLNGTGIILLGISMLRH